MAYNSYITANVIVGGRIVREKDGRIVLLVVDANGTTTLHGFMDAVGRVSRRSRFVQKTDRDIEERAWWCTPWPWYDAGPTED